MTYATVGDGEFAPGDVIEHRITAGAGAKKIRVKADATNTSDILIGATGSTKYHLGKGESMDLELSGQGLFYKNITAADKLYILTLAP